MRKAAWLVVSVLFIGCAIHPDSNRPGFDRDIGGYPNESHSQAVGYSESGMVSYYGDQFQGKRTASGDRFNKNALTAAHRTLPFKTKIRVTNLANGKSVVVEINDRGPFSKNRILDLSQAAAAKIDLIGHGTTKAKITME